jgi:predicted DNA-binding protein
MTTTKTKQKAVRMTPEMVEQIEHLAKAWSLTTEPLTTVAVIREAISRAFLADQGKKKTSRNSKDSA